MIMSFSSPGGFESSFFLCCGNDFPTYIDRLLGVVSPTRIRKIRERRWSVSGRTNFILDSRREDVLILGATILTLSRMKTHHDLVRWGQGGGKARRGRASAPTSRVRVRRRNR